MLSKYYRVRWQIELLFKLYKSHIKLDELKGSHTGYYVNYMLNCVQFLYSMSCTELEKNTELSLTKAFIEFKRRVRGLLLALNNKINNLKTFLKKLTKTWSQFSLKDKYRRTRVSTLTSLNLLTIS